LKEDLDPPPACIGDLASNRDPACIETLSTCHIEVFVYILDFKYETQQTNTFMFHFVETVRLLGLLNNNNNNNN